MSAVRFVFAFVAIAFVVSSTAHGQWWKGIPPEQVWLTQVGFGVHGALTLHDGSFTLPSAPTCCSEYSSAISFGPSLSGFIRQEFTKTLRLNLRVSYIPYGATFETDESLLVSGNISGLSRHTLATSLAFVGAEFIADLRVAGPLRLMIGGAAGKFMQGSFDQYETLVQPGTGTFENGARIRNETRNGTLANLASPYITFLGGVGYDIPLTENHSVMVTPEALLGIGMSDIVSGVSWKANQLRVGATVAFALNAPEPPLPIEYKRKEFVDSVIVQVAPNARDYRSLGTERTEVDTTVTNEAVTITTLAYRTDTLYQREKPIVNAHITARAKDQNGLEQTNFVINVSTQFVSEALPILPVVFFETQAISLSFRYHSVSSPEQFDINAITPRTLAVHRDVLNILGQRMREKPDATVVLRGNADPTTEGGSCDLANKRAETVQNYLTTVWGIAPSRITITQRTGSCAPDRTTREQSEAGYSENRRVEIEASDVTLLAPVAKRRFNEARTVSPPALILDPSGSSKQYVTDWVLTATSADVPVFTKKGEGIPVLVTQQLSIAAADVLRNDRPLTIKLHLNALQGVTADAATDLRVKRDTISIELERLTLTLFEVSSDELSRVAQEQIRRFVDNVPNGSTVIVRGYADMLGNAEFNRKLSQRRADAVCNEIRKLIRKQVSLECTEIATGQYPPGIDSYETPEERFLSRTVQIEIRHAR